MIRLCAFFVVLLFLSKDLKAKYKFSPDVQISILTGEEGKELHTIFGHTIIRVFDPIHSITWLYDFGTFDHNTSSFAWKFITRTLDYHLSKHEGSSHFERLVQSYEAENRTLYEQILDLSHYQKIHLIHDLEVLYNSKDKYYHYDFFFDNCSIRVRDVLANSLGDALHFDLVAAYHSKTFRQLLEPYLKNAWLNLGVTLVLGSPAYSEASDYETMFLPKELMEELDEAYIRYYGREHNLVKEKKILYQGQAQMHNQNLAAPVTIFLILFLILSMGTFWSYLTGRVALWIDFVWLLSLGLVGFALLFLWFGTDHSVLSYNYNLIWALPSHFFIAFLVVLRQKSIFLKYYIALTILSLSFSLVSWFIIPQRLHYSLFLVIAVLIIRSSNLYLQWDKIMK